MFNKGDIVKIKPEYLDKNEDPSTEYEVQEDDGMGHVKVRCYTDSCVFGYYTYVWADYMFYKK